jgi:hypothetical protein
MPIGGVVGFEQLVDRRIAVERIEQRAVRPPQT